MRLVRDGEKGGGGVEGVRRYVGKRKDLGSIPLQFCFLFKKFVVCGHCLVTLSIISY